MFTKKALLTKWGIYSIALLFLLLLQQGLHALPPIFGVLPFLPPMIVAVVAALEGATGGTIFGIVLGFCCDLSGGGVFSGVYTLAFFTVALIVSIISKYWVTRSIFGSLIWAALAFLILDVFQGGFVLLFKEAGITTVLALCAREMLVSILFVIPIFLIYHHLHRLFRYES